MSAVLASQLDAQTPAPTDPFAALRLRSIGPANMSGRITDIAVNESNPYEFYAAAATGGLWKTSDNGVTWKAVWENQSVNSIGAVTVDQRNPRTVWLGSGEATNRQSSGWGDGVYKSTDGGATWTNMGLRTTARIARIVVDPSNSDVVYVAAPGHLWGPNKERGLFKSTDGGRTWALILSRNEDTGAVDVAVDPSDSRIVYAALYQHRRTPFGFVGGGAGSGLYKSTDAGATWTPMTKGLPSGTIGRTSISIYAKDPRVVYASVEQGQRYTSSISYAKRLGGVYRSEDKGETWRFMSDWNPRPAYSSQLKVDPSDQSRLYAMQWSVSDDSGKTWREPRQTLHGDDRMVWVDPRDSRHLIKADDGGVGISYDRGVKWLYVTSLPMSQPYHVSVSTTSPYFVCTGLQDNGSWCGPSATYTSSGPLNDDWFRVGGGDGFNNVIDTTDNNTIYSSSQYLGLSRVNLRTLESVSIRPVGKEGEGPKLGNWGAPEPRVGKKIMPANWNSPVVISPHNRNVIYAGMREVWKSVDRGTTWTSLGDLTTGVDRRSLAIMGQMPTDTTLSLDDGVSYFPSTTSISESPVTPGVLWVGTDDGNLQVSRNGGRTWKNVRANVPGVPAGTWVKQVEASRAPGGRSAYVAFDGHQADDFTNYLFRTDDFGETWRPISATLPADRVIHVIREDLRNRDRLYLGTEQGLYVSADAGANWRELRGIPRLPINDLAIQPRDNDLVVATHARGIFVLDNLNAVQELDRTMEASAAHLFTVEPAEMRRIASIQAHTGDMIFRGENPPNGAIIDYWLSSPSAQDSVAITIHDATGALVASVRPTKSAGVNRVVWNLRLPSLPGAPAAAGDDDDDGPRGAPQGRWVTPGRYTVRLTANGRTQDRALVVRDDPRVTITAAERAAWHRASDSVASIYRQVVQLSTAARDMDAELKATIRELQDRVGTLYGAVLRGGSAPTADQRRQMAYFPTVLATLRQRVPR
ncbi:MAG: glycosyl hydrolase [Gemmatimonadota bacterium]